MQRIPACNWDETSLEIKTSMKKKATEKATAFSSNYQFILYDQNIAYYLKFPRHKINADVALIRVNIGTQ